MSGWYVSVKSRSEVAELFDAAPVGPELPVSYDVAPSNTVYAVIEHTERESGRVERELHNLRCGC